MPPKEPTWKQFGFYAKRGKKIFGWMIGSGSKIRSGYHERKAKKTTGRVSAGHRVKAQLAKIGVKFSEVLHENAEIRPAFDDLIEKGGSLLESAKRTRHYEKENIQDIFDSATNIQNRCKVALAEVTLIKQFIASIREAGKDKHKFLQNERSLLRAEQDLKKYFGRLNKIVTDADLLIKRK